VRRRGIVLTLLGVGVVALGCAALWARFFAGGPVAFFPGGPLRGELVAAPVADWSFAAGEQYLDVQAQGRVLPYSRPAWFMVHEGRLYALLPRLFGDGLERRIEERPDVRVRIGGKVYPVRAQRHADDADLAALLAPVLRRTFSVEIGGAVRAVATPGVGHGGIAIYRLESRPADTPAPR
jgi:hypothetical protein